MLYCCLPKLEQIMTYEPVILHADLLLTDMLHLAKFKSLICLFFY